MVNSRPFSAPSAAMEMKRAILGKKATDGFPIYFTSGKVNKPLVIL
ncbi:hypothetical protein HanRHA438_Chr01g0030831 [Helianthus annuus]|nr:hypothetical protein HanIR_Chr01g0033121 [Helianthus annuus]KAJ0948720.1 hypothetical protein HanRHA438_Chr01g0030831 [Helianthus annuus]